MWLEAIVDHVGVLCLCVRGETHRYLVQRKDLSLSIRYVHLISCDVQIGCVVVLSKTRRWNRVRVSKFGVCRTLGLFIFFPRHAGTSTDNQYIFK